MWALFNAENRTIESKNFWAPEWDVHCCRRPPWWTYSFIRCIFHTHLGRLSDYIPNSLNIYIYILITKVFVEGGSNIQISQIVVDEYHWIPYAFGKSYKIITTVIFEEHHLLFLNIWHSHVLSLLSPSPSQKICVSSCWARKHPMICCAITFHNWWELHLGFAQQRDFPSNPSDQWRTPIAPNGS